MERWINISAELGRSCSWTRFLPAEIHGLALKKTDAAATASAQASQSWRPLGSGLGGFAVQGQRAVANGDGNSLSVVDFASQQQVG